MPAAASHVNLTFEGLACRPPVLWLRCSRVAPMIKMRSHPAGRGDGGETAWTGDDSTSRGTGKQIPGIVWRGRRGIQPRPWTC
jgi:hypothetical protein